MQRKYFVQDTTNVSELKPIQEKEEDLHTILENFPQLLFAERRLLFLGRKIRLNIEDPIRNTLRRELDLVFLAEDGIVIIVEIRRDRLKHDAISQI